MYQRRKDYYNEDDNNDGIGRTKPIIIAIIITIII